MTNKVNFRFPFGNSSNADFDDVFVRRDFFTQGNLWTWGNNYYGELGANLAAGTAGANRSSPIQTVAGGTNWREISNVRGSVSGIKTDGTLWVWGKNAAGQLGTNNTTRYSSPVQVVGNATNWKTVAPGLNATVAIKTDGTLWVWGCNYARKLGLYSSYPYPNFSSPVQTVTGGSDWKAVTQGNNHFLALKMDGSLWYWGQDTCGVFGTNSMASGYTPSKNYVFTEELKAICARHYRSGAITCSGKLFLWGSNVAGATGTNLSQSVRGVFSSPVQTVSAGTNWKQFSLGEEHTSAIKTDGTLWTWGAGFLGKLGTNDSVSRSSPVQTVSGGTNWKQVSNGYIFTGAVKTDGTLWMWGYNNEGQLITNDRVSRSSPVQVVSGMTCWKKLSFATSSAAGIMEV